MKYLKKFNESKEVEANLQDMCDNYLAYLIDEGFRVTVTEQRKSYNICIHKEDSRRNNPYLVHMSDTFNWEDVKENILPFLEVIENDYNIIGINFFEDVNYNWENTFFESVNSIEDYEYTIDNIQIIIDK